MPRSEVWVPGDNPSLPIDSFPMEPTFLLVLFNLILEQFKDEKLSAPVRKKLNYRLMKMLCKDCIVTPYKRFRKDNGYLRFWNAYCGLLSDLKQTGLYQPRYLDLRNRLFSSLFLRRRFSALRLLLNWI